MVGSAIALSLIGLGAVQALPSGKQVEERQIWIGDGTGVFVPGNGELPVCLTDIPLQGQPPCLLPPVVGGLKPGKRELGKRQIWIGDGTGVFIPGNGELPVCLTDIPLQGQPPCLLPPIVGGLNPGKAKRQIWIGNGNGTFIPGPGGLPVCLTDAPLSGQPPCLLPPIVGGLNPGKTRRQIWIGPGNGTFFPGQPTIPICLTDVALQEQPPCILPPIVGGLEPPSLPPKEKRGFVLPPDYATNTKKVIETLELELIRLQNKKHKTAEDLDDIEAIKGALKYLAGIVKITAPPGSESTFTPGKRAFVLPPDYATNTKKVIETLELELIRLQNKRNKTDEDRDDIEAIKAALKYLAGITKITAPPGGESTFTPGKRAFILPSDYATNTKKVIETLELELIRLQNKRRKTQEDRDDIAAIKAALRYLAGIVNITAPPGTSSTFTPGKRDTFSLDTVGTYASVCPNLEGAQIALQTLMHKDKPTVEERIIMQKLAAFLKGCGIVIVKSPDGTYTTIKPSDKRDVSFNPLGLQTAYTVLLQAATTLTPSQPSFANWLSLQHISGVLEILGVSSTITVDSARQPKPRAAATGSDIVTIGSRTCQRGDLLGLRAALAALLAAYGHPSKAPANIYLIEQVLVVALQLCGQSVEGWTTLVPGSTVPGGPIVPDPTVPGGPIIPDPTTPGGPLVPDPTVPGGEVKPSTRKARQAPVGDPTAMLAALKTLEDAYGTYGSGKIPAPVWLIMVNLVTILQSLPGVVVPGWPVLGQGSVVLTPST